MDIEAIKEEIRGVDWSRYDGSEYYVSGIVADALVALAELEDGGQVKAVGRNVIWALGNDHAGAYYPAVLGALDFIIRIEQNTSSEACRRCAGAILNDLYYFAADVEGYANATAEEIEEFVSTKLEPYSDEAQD